jgi:hypothetical protein
MHPTNRLAIVGTMSVLALALSPAAALAHDGGDDIIDAKLMPSLPTFDPINGVNPGGKPWVLQRGEVRVRDSGRMDVRIEGLQIPDGNGGAANPPAVGFIDAVLYCDGMQVADSGPHPMTVPGGDARFRVQLHTVPRDCDMATVLISPSAAVGKAYIASAMAGDEDDDD